MPELTPRLGIKKPLGNENVTRQSFNENWDIIDQKVATKQEFDAHLADTTIHVTQDEKDSWVTKGTTNQDINLITALLQQIDTRTTELSYDGNGNLTSVTEKDGETTVKTTTLDYDENGNLTTVTEDAGGKTITITLNYDGNGNLISVTRSVT